MIKNTEKSWSPKETFWLFCLILMIVIFGASIVKSLLTTIGFENSELVLLSSSGGKILSVTLLYYLIKIKSANPVTDYLAVTKITKKNIVFKYILLYLIYLAFIYIIGTNFEFSKENELSNLLVEIEHVFLIALNTCLIVPIVEEVVFRGFLFKGWVTKEIGVYKGIFIVSLIFTLVHAGQYNLTILVTLFPLSLLLGFARYHSDSLLLPIFIHIAHNTLVYSLNIM